MLAYHQRNFLNAWKRDQANELIRCPNVFTVRAMDGKGLFESRRFSLQLYCQQPGYWHPIGEEGSYEFSQPVEWLRRATPYFLTLLKVLQVVIPLVDAAMAAGSGVVKQTHEKLKEEFKLMSELLKQTDKLNLKFEQTYSQLENYRTKSCRRTESSRERI